GAGRAAGRVVGVAAGGVGAAGTDRRGEPRPTWTARRGLLHHSADALAKAGAFATVQRFRIDRPGPQGPASARPALGGRFSPAGSGAGLIRSRADMFPVDMLRTGGGEAVPRLLPPDP